MPAFRFLPRLGRSRVLACFLHGWLLICSAACVHASQPPVSPGPDSVHIEAKNAVFHISDQSTVHAEHITGWMIPLSKQPVSLDDPHSFRLRIDGGESSISAADMTRLFNQQVLPTAITPVRRVTCSFESGHIVFHGTVHRLVDVDFIAEATVKAGKDGHLLIHTTSVRGASWLSNRMMHVMNMSPASMLKPGPHAQYKVDGDDLDLPLGALFPPPAVEGHLHSVRITGDRLIQNFGIADTAAPPPTAALAYIYFHGGTMQFGKLTMKDVDLELVDKNNSSQINFSIARYYHQLEAGFSKALPSRGVLVYLGGASTIVPGK